jgi:DNA helicase-2/ATP-dependent DNA helicase PcrA
MDLTNVQREIVESPLGACVVTAGAGSGKTRVLTERVLHLLNSGITDREILALTFTNKAAREMKSRIEDRLGKVIYPFLGTFHSWCVRFLREHIQSPFDKNFVIYDRKDSEKIYKKVGENNEYEYKRELEKSNALDFDDLLEKTLDILKSNAEIREKVHDKYKYILVDEFQDTDGIQYQIVKILAKKHRNIMIVGDEDQCVYTWRGAEVENLNSFLKDFPEAKIYKLEENFRSCNNIVELANRLVSHNTNRIDKVLFSRLGSGKIRPLQYRNEREEALMIAMQISNEHISKGTPYSKYAILMRLNATTWCFEEQFRAFKIPYVIWGGFKFYERAEIKSTINYLRALANERDNLAFAEILNFPKRGIGDSSIEKLRTHANEIGITLYNAILNPPKLPTKALNGIREFVKIYKDLRALYVNNSFSKFASSFIETIDLKSAFDEDDDEDLSRLENILRLKKEIMEYAKTTDANLDEYLQSVSLIQDADNDNTTDKVIISTVHSAKGLEFDNVFVIALEDGIFPINRAYESKSEMEEERRLLYVAITRAKQSLYLSHCNSRFYHGSYKTMSPSMFLYECDMV